MFSRIFVWIALSVATGVHARAFGPPHHDGPHGEHHGFEPHGHEYQPPSPFDSRSPCPGLNAMANHGFLPRSGMDISYEDINSAAMQAFNYADGVFLFAFLLANETFHLSTTGSSLTINLSDLDKHNTIEVDGSLSRNDFYFGDDHDFDPAVFAGVAANMGLDGEGAVTAEIAGKALAAREVLAKSVNPTFTASAMQVNGTRGTTGLFLTTMWDDEAKGAPKQWVTPFFEDRIPYREGYKAPTVKTGEFLGDMVKAVTAAAIAA